MAKKTEGKASTIVHTADGFGPRRVVTGCHVRRYGERVTLTWTFQRGNDLVIRLTPADSMNLGLDLINRADARRLHPPTIKIERTAEAEAAWEGAE